MLWIGLTGGIGSGKSSAAGLIKTYGFPVLDADRLAHKTLEKGFPAYLKLIQDFGPDILLENGEIDRKKLASIVFQDKSALARLENIIHPEIQLMAQQFRSEMESNKISCCFYDVPLLYEKNLTKQFSYVVVVAASLATRIQRLKLRNNWSEKEKKNRISFQIPLEEKIAKADFVVQNEGSLDELKAEIANLFDFLKIDRP